VGAERTCPRCGASYSEGTQFCPVDGTALIAEARSDGDPRIGTLVDRYRLTGRLGEGGMGIVYRAEHTIIGRPVALKLLHPNLTTVPEAVDRFFREARAAGEVATEHIVEITDSGRTEDGTNFLVMELLSGRSLADLIDEQQRLDPHRAVGIALQITRALEAAHGRGVVHRDLKPANIQLVPRGADQDFVKILDFGVAKITESNVKLTQTGTIVGSPAYMSPEQASGKTVDRRTDIYALGVILYEMLAGKPPFVGTNATEVLMSHLLQAPTMLREANPAVPESLERVVMQCLAKDPANRPQDMGELRELLAPLYGELPSTSPALPASAPTRPQQELAQAPTGVGPAAIAAPGTGDQPAAGGSRRQGVVIVGVAVLLVAGGVGAWLALRGEQVEQRQTRTVRPDAAPVALAPDSAAHPGPDTFLARAADLEPPRRHRRKPLHAARRAAKKARVDDHGEEHAATDTEAARREEQRRREAQAAKERAETTIVLQSVPSGASVFEGARPLGKTPLTLSNMKQRTLMLTLAGYRARRVSIGPEKRGALTVRLSLAANPALSLSRLESRCRAGQVGPIECLRRREYLKMQRDAELAEARQRWERRQISFEQYKALIDRIDWKYR